MVALARAPASGEPRASGAPLRVPPLAAIEAERAERRLAHFVRQAWPVIEPGTPYRANWHIDAICAHLEAVARGEIRNLLINMPPRMMKPVSINALVLMGDGSRRRLGDVVVGDEVVTHTGRTRLVEAVHDQGDLPCLRIATRAGRGVDAAPDHPFLTPEGWVLAGDLSVGQSLATVARPVTTAAKNRDDAEFRARVPIPGIKAGRLAAWEPKRITFDSSLLPDPIVGIEPVGDVPCRCLTVADDHSFTANDLVVRNSIAVSVMFPAWVWLRAPEKRFLYSSYSAPLATAHSLATRRVVASDWYRARWGDRFALAGDQNLKTRFENDQRGERIATSVGGLATGTGGDFVVVDDAHNVQEAESDAVRRSTLEWWDRVMSTRLNDPKTGARIIVMQRVHECLLPQNGIMTPMGTVRADDVRAGDRVLTSEGPQPVNAVASRHHDGPVVGVRTYGHSETLWVTPEHPLLTDDGWKPAGEIATRDRLVFPIPKGETSKQELTALWPPVPQGRPPKPQRTVTGARGRIPEGELRRLLDEGLKSHEIAARFGLKTRASVDDYVAAYGIVRPAFRAVDAAIVTDPDFWRFVGLWLAEGSFGRGRSGKYERVRFTFSRGEGSFVDDVAGTMERYGLTVTVGEGPSVFQVGTASRQIATFLQDNFGHGAHGKHLPEWAVGLPDAFLKELIRGYWLGDGSQNGKGEIRFASVSMGLLNGIQRALLRLGAVASVMAGGKPVDSFIGTQRVRGGKSWELRVPASDVPWLSPQAYDPPRWRANRIENGRLLVKVKAIEADHYEGPVFDLETPAHDFLCNLVTAHNCDLAGHVLAQGGYEHLCLPMEYEPTDRVTGIGWADPRTAPGELLWPDRVGPAEVADLQVRMGARAYAGQQQQRPAPAAGDLIKRDWIRRYRRADLPVRFDLVAQSWDLTFKRTDAGSFVVGQVWGALGARRWLLDQFRARVDFPGTLAAMRALRAAWPATVAVLVEDQANGPAVLATLADELPGLIPVHPQGGKAARLNAVAPLFEAGDVLVPEDDEAPWVAGWVEEVVAAPNGAHDDQPDAASQALTWLHRRGGEAATADDVRAALEAGLW